MEKEMNFLRSSVGYDKPNIFGTFLEGLCTLTGQCANFGNEKLAIYFENHNGISISILKTQHENVANRSQSQQKVECGKHRYMRFILFEFPCLIWLIYLIFLTNLPNMINLPNVFQLSAARITY